MKLSRRTALLGLSTGLVTACSKGAAPLGSTALENSTDPQVTFEPFDPAFAEVVDVSKPARLLSTGHWWAEGPAWDNVRNRLYFTDVPRNRAYAWDTQSGQSVFLDPSGVAPEQAGGMREPGANGLLLGASGELLICNHGARAVEAMDLETGKRRTLASEFTGKRFNSPNDLIETSDRAIYFSDPPYGLEGLNDSPLKQLDVNGVYRLSTVGQVSLIVDDMSFPNGVALSPDERFLYVAQSDPEAPLIRRIDLHSSESDGINRGELWFDCRPFMHEVGGLPDGMAITTQGHVFLAGPGGVLVIDNQAKCLGRIFTGRASANCTFGEDGRTLFITAGDRLVSVETITTGIGRY